MYTQIRARARDALTLNFDQFLNLDLVLCKKMFCVPHNTTPQIAMQPSGEKLTFCEGECTCPPPLKPLSAARELERHNATDFRGRLRQAVPDWMRKERLAGRATIIYKGTRSQRKILEVFKPLKYTAFKYQLGLGLGLGLKPTVFKYRS